MTPFDIIVYTFALIGLGLISALLSGIAQRWTFYITHDSWPPTLEGLEIDKNKLELAYKDKELERLTEALGYQRTRFEELEAEALTMLIEAKAKERK